MKNLLQGVQITFDLKVISRNMLFVVPTLFIMSFLYLWSNHKPISKVVENTVLLDQSIPFIGWTITIYWFVLIVTIMGVLLLREIKHVYMLLAVNAISFLINFIIWFYYPVVYPRVEHSLTGISQKLFSILFYLDAPTNSFPSGHVSLMCLLAWTGYSLKSRSGNIMLLISIAGVLSVFTTQQHTVIDALAGGLTVVMALIIVKYYLRLKTGLAIRNNMKYPTE